jgi:hypothetical protein
MPIIVGELQSIGYWEKKMTDDELKALVASLAVVQQITDEQMRRNDKILPEKLGNIGVTLGNVPNEIKTLASERTNPVSVPSDDLKM